MTRITLELLRKRSEHNDKVLSTLKEITLHQFEIKKIELIDNVCRELEILYLQNNVIRKIENLSRLRALRYLQLSLNNVSVIENLEGCESLYKLDLTCNFVEDPTCIAVLTANEQLRHLFLVGNPVAKYPMYREYVLSVLPRLESLDGTDVSREEVILAAQQADEAAAAVAQAYAERLAARAAGELKELTPDEREEIYAEVEAEKAEKEAARNPFPIEKKPDRVVPIYKDDGRVYQCNWGKYAFKLVDDDEALASVLEVRISKFLDTSLIDVDVQPDYIRVTIKGKVLQLALDVEVQSDKVVAQRSQATGNLVVTMPWAPKVLAATAPGAASSAAIDARLARISLSRLSHGDHDAAGRTAAIIPMHHAKSRVSARAAAKRRAARAARIAAGTATDLDLYEDEHSDGSDGATDSIDTVLAGTGLAGPVSLHVTDHAAADIAEHGASSSAAAAGSSAGRRRKGPKPVSADFVDNPDVPPLE
ncbi:leucine rich repeat containing 6 [Thecamonas trahens ATCC 50062]|uniref:Leucine rich repeat containing 6 n=1 Tax=Thecamonas trahens ATCC 50062 TaxID=461836 RepID=A0A0L0DSZ9_THETB|nr:leucine rich repeat containing 6 [Thecamonas trahens ATCC 50062]KNC55146.1 leucine rich repeat containing 6 [Thecamonas trahens ATCC 50062]|eukprot:XP_013753203.1 leucine rich repeat containing 6 [Thecamonas trahens ATCC 50062]